MFKKSKSVVTIITVLLIFVLLLTPFFRMQSSAAELGQTFLFLERMKVNLKTDMYLLITPSTTFNSGTDDRVLNIFFPPGSAEWCRTDDTTLTVAGVTTSAVDIDTGVWTIDAALPGGGSLVGKCFQAAGGDYIQVTGITALTAGTSYGLKISSHDNFKLKNAAASYTVSINLVEGTKSESKSFQIVVLAEDQVTVTATVVNVHTITCTLPDPTTVSLGSMYLGGAYITATHTLGTNSTSPYYWAVYGTGNGTDAAGLYQPLVADPPRAAYLIPSVGSGSVVNLITSAEGFGLSISATADGNASPATNYNYTTPGVFGSVLYGFSGAKLILNNTTSGSDGLKNATIVLGARASTSAVAGTDYEEKLTYICGAYIAN